MNRSLILSNKYLIMQLLRLSELQYSEIIEQLGYEYLRTYFSDKNGNIDDYSLALVYILAHSKTFWIWWLFRWNDNDEKYLKSEHKPCKNAYIDFHRSLFYPMPDSLFNSIVLKLKSEEYDITE